jgi:hypothetical protein
MTPEKRLPPHAEERQSGHRQETRRKPIAPPRHDLGSFALGLAGADLPVFPLLPRSKQPRVAGPFLHGFHDATTDAERIDRHWYLYPSDNIGLRPPLGMAVAVLDIDPRHGGRATMARLLAEHGPLPQTWTARTGSGGRHLWFVVGEIQVRCNLGPESGVDIKHGGTGYVVAPPSIHPNGSRYEWLIPPVGGPAMAPDWLLALVRRPVYVPAPVTGTASGTGQYSLQCLLRRIETATEGRRNVTVYGAMRDAHRQGDLSVFEAVLTVAAVARGLCPVEVAAIVRSARRGR